MNKKLFYISAFILTAITASFFTSCSNPDEIITALTTVEVSAKERLDSANAQAKRKYGDSTSLVLIMGKNVKSNGKTELSVITAITTPDSIGAWLYIYRVPSDTSLRIYTPNPIPTTNDCIELTAFFNPTMLVGLIKDTSARNIIDGALDVIITADINVTTPVPNLLESYESLNLANATNPIIKFNSNFTPDTSSLNGNLFFSTGSNRTINMFLIPAAGTLNLPAYIQNLTGFPADLWAVQYKKTNSSNQTESLMLGTVVQSGQMMMIPPPVNLQSPVINLSKYVVE